MALGSTAAREVARQPVEVGTHTTAVAVTEQSAIAEARRQAAHLARALSFDETAAGRAALLVTEAATNILKHAGSGTLLLRALEADGARGIEVLALDRGPGLARPAECLRDGFSTAGSPGTGLGALQRNASQFELFTVAGQGTALLVRLWGGDRTNAPGIRVGAVSVAKPGETACGDAWAAAAEGARFHVMVADGLGHGPDAARAAREAVRVFEASPAAAPGEVLRRQHLALRPTRGAAVAVAEVDASAGCVRLAGVGNVSATVLGDGAPRRLMSHNGIVGHEVRRVQEFDAPWPGDGRLVLHSDGLSTQWDAARYPGILARDPALLAGLLYRDHCRGRDDATVVVTRTRA